MIDYWISQSQRCSLETIKNVIFPVLHDAVEQQPGVFASRNGTEESTGLKMDWNAAHYAPYLRQAMENLNMNQMRALLMRVKVQLVEEEKNRASSPPAVQHVETHQNAEDELSSLSNSMEGN